MHGNEEYIFGEEYKRKNLSHLEVRASFSEMTQKQQMQKEQAE